MFERFTDRSRMVLVEAQIEAKEMGCGFIGTEHILLGLAKNQDGVAGKVLLALRLPYDGLRRHVLAQYDQDRLDKSRVASPPFTPRAKKVMELALREALQLGHNYIGTEHLLLGIVRDGDGIAANVLLEVVGDLAEVRQAVIQLISGAPYPSLLSSATVTFALPKSLEQAIYARSRDLRQAVGNLVTRHELPVPLLPTSPSSGQGEMSLEQCKQFVNWCQRLDDLVDLANDHPFMVAAHNIRAAIDQAEQAHIESELRS
ncbi:MAG TPA: Clp protease N-terminal domain-containing protein [Candidatus Nanoarchaeia archaeon]|nr:Clp protease N-terminal domain-containing protein [Candidatus Nanoarchaeia archaeon]